MFLLDGDFAFSGTGGPSVSSVADHKRTVHATTDLQSILSDSFSFFQSNRTTTSVMIWSFVLVAFLVAGFIIVGRVKKRMKDEIDTTPEASAGFTLSDLRQMHRDGQISDEEFERAKAKIVEAARRAAEREDKNTEKE